MRAPIKLVALTGVLTFSLIACDETGSILDAGARHPDVEGVVKQISFQQVTLDTGRSFQIDEAVESFTTRGHDVTPLMSWQSKYVHIGLNDEKRVKWIAGIGVATGDPPIVRYAGVLLRIDDDQAFFEDGTVLKVDPRFASSRKGEVLVTIDAANHKVTSIVPSR